METRDEKPELSVDVGIQRGEFGLDVELETAADRVALVGPSGAGKTTLLRAVAGLEKGVRGRVVFRGEVWRGEAGTLVPAWERGVGWVPQDWLVFPHLTARGNLEYADPPEEEAARVARALELEGRLDLPAPELSGGERQRVAIGRAVLSSPRLLVFDEPFSALDRQLTDRVSAFLDDWCSGRGVGLLIAAHSRAGTGGLVEETYRLTDRRIEPVVSE